VIAVHIVLAALACVALWRLWRGATRVGGPAALIISLGFLLRAVAGQALFWISWLQLPIARSLQIGDGYWFFAVDSPGYMAYAWDLSRGIALRVYPSRVFVDVLAAFVFALGRVASIAIVLNCAAFLATCAVIVFIGRNAPKPPVLAALAAVALGPGSVLWSLQPLKDPLLLFLITAMIGACFLWQEASVPRQRVAAAAAMILFLYAVAGIRWYFAIFALISVAVFALIVALRAPRKAPLLAAGAALCVLLGGAIELGAGWELPAIRIFHPQPLQRLEKTRLGFASAPGATTIVPGRALGPAPAATSAPVPQPRPRHIPLPTKIEPPVKRIVATAAVTFLPRFLVELLGLAHVGGGHGLWLFVETDTLAFDAVLLFAVVWSVRARRGVTPLWIMLALLFVITTVPVIYVINNFGTLVRTRQMIYLIAALLPLTSARPRR
jgi:hypothetical protein